MADYIEGEHIYELDKKTELEDSDVFIVEDDEATKQTTLEAIKDSLKIFSGYNSNILRGTNSTKLINSTTSWADGTWRAINASGTSRTSTLIDISDSPNANLIYGVETYTESGSTYAKIRQDGVPMIDGATYTISAYARGDGTFQFQYGMSPYINQNFDITSEWERYSYTFTFDGSECGSTGGTTWIYVGGGSPGTVQFCGIKLETGEYATEWTPNEYDVGGASISYSYDSTDKNMIFSFS